MSKNKSRGMSLVELMIAMAIGLVVIGSVLSFTMSSLNTNSEYVQATRLSQELRNTMDFVTRELRRAGYDENVGSYPARYAVSGLVTPTFSKIFVTPTCVLFAYDRTGGTPGTVDLARGEIRGFRLMTRTVDGVDVGVIEVAESAAGVTPSCTAGGPNYSNYPPTLNAGTGWSSLTDPRVLNITQFNLDTSGYITQTGSATSAPVVLREIDVQLQGQLRNSLDGTVTRGIQSTIRIRADCIGAATVCDDEPSGI
ncbi:MAG: prepilin-type N-terminal cleavage/methylation domain-containing protein [Arenimonas sp.]|nr:prepilin-type N-terminal cleavage/methylation domain-containing protein [Arenimonas sp.]